jgi:3-deoxy-D-manno-octulosonic-acid transferase
MLTVLLLVYNLLLPVVFLITLPGVILKNRKRGGTRAGLAQRFGFYENSVSTALAHPPDTRIIWIHAVSVGEAQVAVKLARALRAQDQNCQLVLTTATPTGQAIAREGAATLPGTTILFAPFDLPFCVHRAIKTIRPTDFVILESELWPNLLRALSKRGIPITLANARLSPRSEKRYHSLRWLTAPLLQIPQNVLVSTPTDTPRWERIGVPASHLQVTGNTKYDQSSGAIPSEQIERLRLLWENSPFARRHPVVLAASTHPGEETLIAQACRDLLPSHPDLALILVPRHAERCPSVKAELESQQFTVHLRSVPQKTPDQFPPATLPILLVNVTGELAAWHHLSDVVVVGKSFLAHGGQNPAEGVIAGKPGDFWALHGKLPSPRRSTSRSRGRPSESPVPKNSPPPWIFFCPHQKKE